MTCAHLCLQSRKIATRLMIQLEMLAILTEMVMRGKKSNRNQSVMTLAITIPSKTPAVNISILREVATIVASPIPLNRLLSTHTVRLS